MSNPILEPAHKASRAADTELIIAVYAIMEADRRSTITASKAVAALRDAVRVHLNKQFAAAELLPGGHASQE